jgi:uncharacterized LabA/DUF88 family protein
MSMQFIIPMSAAMHKWPPLGYDPGVFFYMPTNRTTFLVDGFNLYHSVVDASNDIGGASTKWLNIRSLCESYLHIFGRDNKFERLYYFSALATHMNQKDPSTVSRHEGFIDCLKSTGAIIELSTFKQKFVWCSNCHRYILHHEEKETDVSLSVKLIELFWHDECDTAILLTGDTDIAPAIRFVKAYFPQKTVGFLFPYKRKNKELRQLALGCKISSQQYLKHQFPNPVTLPDGSLRFKPAGW